MDREPFLLYMSSVTLAITRWGMEAALGTLQGRAEKAGVRLTQGPLFLEFLPVLSSSSNADKIPHHPVPRVTSLLLHSMLPSYQISPFLCLTCCSRIFW